MESSAAAQSESDAARAGSIRIGRRALAVAAVVMLFSVGLGIYFVTRAWQGLSAATVTVGRDTTYLEGPLDDQGFVDYPTALNREMSAGVTPEKNAAVPLLLAFGPKDNFNPEYFGKLYRLLGMEPLLMEGDYYVSAKSLLEKQASESGEITGEDGASPDYDVFDLQEQFWNHHEEASTRPWTAKEFPDLARWIAVNETPLELIVEASRRPKCYLPIVLLDSEERLASYSAWLAQKAREACRLLSVRATLRVGEGRVDEAWEDLLAGHRLARHISQSPMVMEGLMSLAMEGVIARGQVVLIHYGELSPGQIRRIEEDVSELPARGFGKASLTYGDRLQTIDSIVCLSQLTFAFEEFEGSREREIGQKLFGAAGRAAIDWDEILRITNWYYDRVDEAIDRPSYAARREAIRELETTLDDACEQSRGMGRFLRSFLSFRSPKKTFSWHFGHMHLGLLHSSTLCLIEAEVRGMANRRMMQIAMAAAAYRAEYGVYPESLDRVRDYLEEVPVDPYSDQPFRYRLDGDGYVLYAVGPNGLDEKGRNADVDRDERDSEADDISLHVPPIWEMDKY